MSLYKHYNFAKKILFPICRSITGNGIKLSLKKIKKNFPKMKIIKISSGKNVFDWKIPPEWNVKDAYVKDKFGKKIIDFKKNNLHLISYSSPIRKKINKNDLLKKLYYLKKQPKAIPYITSYYKKNWGFCVNYNEIKKIKKFYKNKDAFNVCINSNYNNNGNLSYGELILKGKSKKEILISTYLCHPSMANNELSGPIVSMSLIEYFSKFKNFKYTIRFVFIPETIGSITFLNKNLDYLKKNVIAGFNLTCIGDERQHSCMFTKYGNTLSDKALKAAYKKLKIKYKVYSFLQRGSDERQYNSPGVELPIASIFRSKYWEYPEYHTSLDDFKLVTMKGINGGFKVAKEAINFLMKSVIPISSIKCEPQMSKRNLYPLISEKNNKNKFSDFLNFLQYSDGRNTFEEICNLSNIKYKRGFTILKKLKKEKLILNENII